MKPGFKKEDCVEIDNSKDRYHGCKGHIEEVCWGHYLVRIESNVMQYFEHELKGVE